MRLIDADDLEKRFEYLATVGNDLVHKVTEEEKGMRTAYHLAKYETHVAPTISPESLRPQWIPVTERLPDVCRDEKGVLIPFLVSGAGGKYPSIAVYNNGIWSAGLFRVDVTAWMPLPSVYKLKDKEE